MSFIGIDLGTSFIKGAVLNLQTRRLEHTRRIPFPNRLELANPLLCETDPNEIVAVVRMLIDDLALQAPNCEGVLMSSQMHGMILMDEHGQAFSNCISWLDHRGLMPHPSGLGSYLDVLDRRISLEQRRQLGNELGLERPVCFLFWLTEQEKLKPGLVPASIPDFVLSVLCGSSPSVEVTNASASGFFNIEKLDWHQEVIDKLGLQNLRLPVVRNEGDVVGYLKFNGRQVPCYIPIGDIQCALVGALLGPEEISLNISTGSQVSRLMPELKLGDYQTRPFFEGSFLNTFTDAPGGRSLNVLVNLLTEFAATQTISSGEDPWTSIARAARKVWDTDLEVDLSFFESQDGNRGRISNIHGNNLTVGHLFRAAFKEMAEVYYSYACKLWPERSWNNIAFSGGLAHKLPVFREIIEDKFETEYRLCPVVEDALFGLLVLALVFSRRADSIKEATQQLRAEQPEILKW